MNKKIKTLIFAFAITLSAASCFKDVPLENDPKGESQSLLNMKNAFISASGGITPMQLKKDEWALFKIEAKLYTGQFQGLGYRASQVLNTEDGTVVIENQSYDTKNLIVVATDYKEPVDGAEPEIEVQKEWNCKFIKPPYYLWYDECPLPPEQNFWVFQGITEPAVPIFFAMTKYTKREKLPQKLIDENRCYDFVNCEIDVNYLEYDMIGKNAEGVEQRIHYVTSFSGELPYTASNLKTCYSTLLEINGQKHPGEVCQELVNFKPGE